ncbi:rhodanese-like domain-containing protein [Quisquiliibacterium transsilvanicum]|jgi:rhodanese-related sulfurtransferase|uniref:Rhodanese-related sulfurtransferase n=1 Tax=Quisquiliibacterium transsilvanicum TaxID=1549638 RepID=A0A7W8M8T9_9BURK|nr:rhodanese-like domain-containing protein [Quisquiliibacterium transsilvanicum]MBB5271992.1 rhodanese-related sulfurtransferase [Quisquiliibacterium transsilvanicum]
MSHAPLQLDPPSALERLNAGTAWLVDVRERAEIARAAFDAPNVVVIPLSEFERRRDELPRDQDLILACASGGRSFQAVQYLIHHGYSRVTNLAGGIGLWHAHGLPVTAG